MKKEDIERLPPELQPAAELCEELLMPKAYDLHANIAFKAAELLPAALTYCLQMQEERDEAARQSDSWEQVAIGRISDLQTAEATIATLTREAADDALHNKFRDEVFDKYEKQVATLTREKEALETLRWEAVERCGGEIQKRKTAEAETTRLRGELEKIQDLGDRSMVCSGIKPHIIATEAMTRIARAALSHTPEGKTNDL